MATLKVFAFDHACAGGAGPTRSSAAQRFDGELMLRALCADLRRLPGVELVTLDGAAARPAGGAFDRCFTDCVLAADAVWPLAPVGSGVLERLSQDVLRHGRILLGSTPAAVRLAGSKRAACHALLGAGIPTVATFGPGDTLPAAPGAWVVKPDDGAGCIDTRLFHDRAAAQLAAAAHVGRELVLQPFVAGRVGSLSLLCRDGAACVLACNEQRMAVHDNHFRFLGVTVNGLAGMAPQLEALGLAVAAALPGLWGYAGVDFILADSGPLVLDVNPRLTISYAGLHASTGINPAGAVLSLLQAEMPLALPGRMPACIVDVPAFAPD
ncbi:ATP-grasp domain-containing protein [Pseudoduganella sp. SL102]|uniref:ATP-grasp domain-containing protein n=1 Tax=Pseudoduganella sp. SL102 TaxID=2995154 RepID=UPI00248C8792|nr:ATP-grasp domain-containing protein [Pseudoduganella sp. SL102]WBS02906.1 ATP-grasp domain-containing protein [Pseudoduganella sp. SL102]